MNRSVTLRAIIIAASLALLPLASAGAPAKAAGCNDCHGKDGASASNEVPTIAGISAFALEEQLAQYKTKQRPCAKVKFVSGNHPADAKDDMCTIASKLSDVEITELASHYDGLKFVPFKNTSDAAKAATGRQYHEKNCEKCHTTGGSVAADDASILAGQPKGYLVLAFKELRATEREMDKKMAPKIKALTDADVAALIEFYAGGGK